MTIQPDYSQFLLEKMARPIGVGFECVRSDLPSALKPFQADIVTWALRRGQAAVFAGTGLGKTLMQLAWARTVMRATGMPVLILAPLAVAEQTPEEALKFAITSVAYASGQADILSAIVVSNYDRIENFDLSRFGGVVLDESSIIKAHESKTRAKLIALCAHLRFKLCCTATPAPNDYVELGNHAEFLGVLTQKEMLATWFVHDGSMKAKNVKNHDTGPKPEWRLKGHAENEFWAWVSSWAVMLRHPRELGYDEPGYDLPPLYKHQITVPSDLPLARTLSERLAARRASIEDRCRWAAAHVNAYPDRPWSIWCNMNDESALLAELIPDAVEVRGSDKPAVKKDRLLGFAAGRYPKLITKGSIAGFGLNFQVCADTVLVGLNDSFEQLYQLIRRHWRFGQTREVNAWLVASQAEGNVVANLEEKEAAADVMYAEMAKHTATLMTRSLQETRELVPHNAKMEIPTWLMAA